MSVPIARIIEMPLNQGMYLYLCPCGAAEWGKDRWPYFQEGWKARHLESCCSTQNATHRVCEYAGTQREFIDYVNNGVGIIAYVFHERNDLRNARHKWYAIESIYA